MVLFLMIGTWQAAASSSEFYAEMALFAVRDSILRLFRCEKTVFSLRENVVFSEGKHRFL